MQILEGTLHPAQKHYLPQCSMYIPRPLATTMIVYSETALDVKNWKDLCMSVTLLMFEIELSVWNGCFFVCPEGWR